MREIHAEVAIIGGGSAGMSAFRHARKHTDDVYLIEDHHFGTTCARVGCMPSKLLIAAAEAAYHAQHTDAFGVHLNGSIQIDGKEVMQRVRTERDRFVGFVLEDVDEFPSDKKILGRAKFINEHLIQVDDHTQIHAQRIVIATGSRPFIPSSWYKLGDRLITNEEIFDWHDLPKSVAVMGLGVIALELGQALHRLGVEIHCFVRSDRKGNISDPVILEKSKEIFHEELAIHFNTVPAFERVGDKVKLCFEDNNQPQELEVDYVLASLGRVPNTDNIGLENLDIILDYKGVPIVRNKYTMQTTLEHIFIAGDSADDFQLLHEAADQGVIAGNNAGAYPQITEGLRRSLIAIIFSDPQIAAVGSRWENVEPRLLDDPDSVVTGEVSFRNQGRSRVMLVNRGHLRLYAEKSTGRFLGAEMVGPAVEHLAHLLAWAHQQKMTIAQMLEMPFYHPVIEEGVRTALRDANAKL